MLFFLQILIICTLKTLLIKYKFMNFRNAEHKIRILIHEKKLSYGFKMIKKLGIKQELL